jgi:hypothetical protein
MRFSVSRLGFDPEHTNDLSPDIRRHRQHVDDVGPVVASPSR